MTKTPPTSNLTIQNGKFENIDLITPLFPENQLIYDVFRVASGKPLFLKEHLERLYNGIKNAGYSFSVIYDDFIILIKEFILKSAAVNGNIKIEIYFSQNSLNEHFYRVFFIPTSYPDKEMYQKGVICKLLYEERSNPSIKIANPALRNISDSIILQENIFETILVNAEKLITEGSRSNIFFVKDDLFITAPDSMVLSGIIRSKAIELITKNNMKIGYRAVSIDELSNFDACFITGTSPRVLPIRQIDDIIFEVPNKQVQKLMEMLDKKVLEEIYT